MNRIRELRKSRGLNQTELGKQLHISQAMVSEYESGQTPMTNDLLSRMADFFGVSIDYIIGRDTDPQKTTVVTDGGILYRPMPQHSTIPEETISSIVQRVRDGLERDSGSLKLTPAEQQRTLNFRQLTPAQRSRIDAMIEGYLDAKYDK